MAGCRFYFKGELRNGKVVRVDFAHHKAGKRTEARKLNVHPLVARLILGKMATLHEMNTVYSLQDMLYLSEVLDLQEEATYLRNKKNGN